MDDTASKTVPQLGRQQQKGMKQKLSCISHVADSAFCCLQGVTF